MLAYSAWRAAQGRIQLFNAVCEHRRHVELHFACEFRPMMGNCRFDGIDPVASGLGVQMSGRVTRWSRLDQGMPNVPSVYLDNGTKPEPITILGDDTSEIPDFRVGSKVTVSATSDLCPKLGAKRT